MNEKILQNLIIALQTLSDTYKHIDTEKVVSNLYVAIETYFDQLKMSKYSDEMIQSMSKLLVQYGELSELQLIALSKEARPSDMELTDNQKKIRSGITREEAVTLKDSVEIELKDGRLQYKNEKISLRKVKTAIEIKKLFDDISVGDILDFSSLLYECPYLALRHPIGEKIFIGCASIPEEYITNLNIEIPYYRAREMKDEADLFSDSEMDKAPFKIPGQGRFNTEGVSRFYVAAQSEDAADEIVKHSRSKGTIHIQIAKYKANRMLKVFDFEKMSNKLSNQCTRNVLKPDKFNTEYLLSGFLAQCLSYYKNLDGIKYGSMDHELYAFFSDKSFEHSDRLFVKKEK